MKYHEVEFEDIEWGHIFTFIWDGDGAYRRRWRGGEGPVMSWPVMSWSTSEIETAIWWRPTKKGNLTMFLRCLETDTTS